MKKLWRRFKRSTKRFFKKLESRDNPGKTEWKPEPVKPSEIKPVVLDKVKENEILGILIFVPHTPKSFGTATYNGIKEHVGVAAAAEATEDLWVEEGITGVRLEVRYRLHESYRSYCRQARSDIKKFAKKLGCDPKHILAIETHYNGSESRSARGGYYMVEVGEFRAVRAAKIAINYLVKNTPMTFRKKYMGQEGVKGVTSGRGSGWVDYSNDHGAISMLEEPLYCNWKTEQTEWLFGPQERLTSKEKLAVIADVAEKTSVLRVAYLKEIVIDFQDRTCGELESGCGA